jgi:glycosyltransferase involved in cell wall biosynthesis
MTVRRLIYIANARLPTEKAHGFQICKMCEAFVENGVDVELWHPSRNQTLSELRAKSVFDYYGIRRIFRVKTVPNVDVVRLEPLFPKGIFKYGFFLHALMWGLYVALAARKEKADLYFTRDSQVAYWLVRLRLPTVYEAHVARGQGQRRLLQAISKARMLKLVVALAESIRQEFLALGFPGDKIIVQGHGVDLALFSDLPIKQECRARLSLPPERFILGYVGRFEASGVEKGVRDLVRAMKYLPSCDGVEPLLLCVGGPMDRVREYYDLAHCLGIAEKRLLFVDRVPNSEVPYWIRACDLVLLPLSQSIASSVGTMPLKMLEYMAAGAPIIASDFLSIREVIRHGENGWLVDACGPAVALDSEALAKAINYLMCNSGLRTTIASQAKKKAASYSWKARVASILSQAQQLS